jgi:hypothetical protein
LQPSLGIPEACFFTLDDQQRSIRYRTANRFGWSS